MSPETRWSRTALARLLDPNDSGEFVLRQFVPFLKQPDTNQAPSEVGSLRPSLDSVLWGLANPAKASLLYLAPPFSPNVVGSGSVCGGFSGTLVSSQFKGTPGSIGL